MMRLFVDTRNGRYLCKFFDDLEECRSAHHVRVRLHDDAALWEVLSCG